MKNLQTLACLLPLVIAFSCESPQKQTEEVAVESTPENAQESRTFPENLTKVLDAHGGYDLWNSMNQLSYVKGSGEDAETQLIELKNRKVLLTSANHTIGFDGNDVWISPADAEFRGSPRFYHNLYFYFFAMPFVLSDPGIVYSETEALVVDSIAYPGIKVSYNDGVGDSPKDNYILYYNPENYQMTYLKYTVTYRSQEESDQYSLIKYDEWVEADGLALPGKLVWYKYEDGQLGEVRNEAAFTDIKASSEVPNEETFTKPEGAKISEAPTTE